MIDFSPEDNWISYQILDYYFDSNDQVDLLPTFYRHDPTTAFYVLGVSGLFNLVSSDEVTIEMAQMMMDDLASSDEFEAAGIVRDTCRVFGK